jgi:predicted ferric reductase
MKVVELETWCIMFVGIILVLVYGFLLVHVYTGSQNKWLFWQIIMLMLSNITCVTLALSIKFLFEQGNFTPANIYLFGISIAI